MHAQPSNVACHNLNISIDRKRLCGFFASIGKIPKLVEREIIDSSDDESQASNGSFEERMKMEYYVGHVFVPTRKKTNEDGNEIGSVKSECSDSSKKIPPVKRLKLKDEGSVGSYISVNSSSSNGSDSRG